MQTDSTCKCEPALREHAKQSSEVEHRVNEDSELSVVLEPFEEEIKLVDNIRRIQQIQHHYRAKVTICFLRNEHGKREVDEELFAGAPTA